MDVHDIISAPRIRWSLLTNAQIRKVWEDACMYEDRELVRRARRALARRRKIADPDLRPVQGPGSSWGASDSAGGVWWPLDGDRVTASNVCILATHYPHLGRWHS